MTGNEISITFMRHGRSRADDEQVHEGRYDSPLTEVGRTQAQARASQWQAEGMRFDCIVASTLQRAHETAKIVAQALNAPLETDSDWMEIDNGPLAGVPFDAVEVRFPKHPYEPFMGTGESDWEIHCRAVKAVQKIVRRGAGQYLVVAHGGILNAALRGIVGAQPNVNGQGIWFALGDTGYARAVYRPEKYQWILRELRAEM